MTPSSNLLETIVAERRADAAAAKRLRPIRSLERAAERRRHHSLAERLRRCAAPRVIAEMKKASPSAGLLRESYDPAALAKQYAEAGAVGLSVLTEPRRFLGSGEHLEAARAATDLPILRKDFLCDPYHLYEAAAWGADAVLLIVAALQGSGLGQLYCCAESLGLEVLVEAHTAQELDIALECETAIVGVNSRDLRTLETDLGVAERLAARIPRGRLAVAESGIRSGTDVRRLEALGYAGFLVGEALLRRGDPGANLRALIAESRGETRQP
jgi:indole-3-glycerol phosphate synthase